MPPKRPTVVYRFSHLVYTILSTPNKQTSEHCRTSKHTDNRQPSHSRVWVRVCRVCDICCCVVCVCVYVPIGYLWEIFTEMRVHMSHYNISTRCTRCSQPELFTHAHADAAHRFDLHQHSLGWVVFGWIFHTVQDSIWANEGGCVPETSQPHSRTHTLTPEYARTAQISAHTSTTTSKTMSLALKIRLAFQLPPLAVRCGWLLLANTRTHLRQS